MEDEHTMHRRRSLQATQRRLTAAIDLITTVAPEVVARPKPAKVQPMKGQEAEEMVSVSPAAAAQVLGGPVIQKRVIFLHPSTVSFH